MVRDTVTLCVPYVEDERRFLLHAVQAALEAHRALQTAARGCGTTEDAAGGGLSAEHEQPQTSSGQDHAGTSVREIIFGLF